MSITITGKETAEQSTGQSVEEVRYEIDSDPDNPANIADARFDAGHRPVEGLDFPPDFPHKIACVYSINGNVETQHQYDAGVTGTRTGVGNFELVVADNGKAYEARSGMLLPVVRTDAEHNYHDPRTQYQSVFLGEGPDDPDGVSVWMDRHGKIVEEIRSDNPLGNVPPDRRDSV